MRIIKGASGTASIVQHSHHRGTRREQGIKNTFEEIMMENFPILMKETDIQAREVQNVPNKMNPNIPTKTNQH